MRYCPDCKAPNPASRTACYACGQSLTLPVSPNPAGEHTYPCLTCRADIPYSATACPGCGRVISPSSVSAVAPALEDGLSPQQAVAMNRVITPIAPPNGWTVEPLPDGTVRLTRNGWQRLWRDARPLLTFLGVILFPILRLISRSYDAPGYPPRTEHVDFFTNYDSGLAVIFLIVAAGLFLWSIRSLFGREELRAGRSLLQVRKELGPFRSVQELTSGVIRLDSYHTYTRNGMEIRRRLRAENLGRHITLDGRDRSAFWYGMMPDEELNGLGRYLAAITGWPFVSSEGAGTDYLRPGAGLF